ncbi:hypothetical protein C8R45DRAFT_1119123 [Mycena sanguinolenta]|nr:hypothetical protein C8R45DRAFT_1119123 [Mycena sanguinolenta]
MSATVPKAVLYYSPDSTWSSSVLLALEEKGYGDDELDLKVVDLSKGENFTVSFLRLNAKATVPTLVVPFRDSVSDDAETRYKALTDTKAIINLLEQSRSPMSTSRTTSTAPAPALAPATVAFNVTGNALLDIFHADEVSPEMLKFVNARDNASLKTLANTAVPLLEGRKQALAECISEAESGKVQASEKVKKFWQDKQNETDQLLAVLLAADKGDAALDSSEQTKRAEFIAKAKEAWEVSVKGAVVKLNKEMIGPYALGDQLSVVDLSLAPWLRTVVMLAGGSAEEDGSTAIGKVEQHLGGDLVLPKDFQGGDLRQKDSAAVSKLAAYWDAMKERASWKKVYM